jgi:hypothetical protein
LPDKETLGCAAGVPAGVGVDAGVAEIEGAGVADEPGDGEAPAAAVP